MQPGNYVVGFFQGVVKDGDYQRFEIAANEEGEGFIQRLSYREIREDGSRVIDGALPVVGDLVLVRVFEEVKNYGENKEKSFIARRVLGVTVLDRTEPAA